MNKVYITASCITFIVFTVFGCSVLGNMSSLTDISGTWNGEVKSDSGQIQKGVMKIVKNDRGQLSGTLIAAGEGGQDIPIDEITVDDKKIHFAIPSINGIFNGTINDEGTDISGIWEINNVRFTVQMKKEQ